MSGCRLGLGGRLRYVLRIEGLNLGLASEWICGCFSKGIPGTLRAGHKDLNALCHYVR